MDRNTSSNNAFRQLLDAAMDINSQSPGSENRQMAPPSAGSEVQQLIPQNATQGQQRGHDRPPDRQQLHQQQDQEQLQRRQHQEQLERQPLYQEQRRRQQESIQEQLQRQRLRQQQLQQQRQAQHQHQHPTQTVGNPSSQSAESEIHQMAPPNATEAQRRSYNPQLFRYHPYSQQLQQQREAQLQGQRQYQYEKLTGTVRNARSQSAGAENQRIAAHNIAQARRYGFDPSHLQQRQHHRRQYQYRYEPSTHMANDAYQQIVGSSNRQMAHYQPLHEGLVQPRSEHERPHFGYSPPQTADDHPYAREQRARYDSQPQRQDFGQPPTVYQRSQFGSAPQQIADDHRFVPEQRPRYDNRPQRQGFGQLQNQQQQPHVGSLLQQTGEDHAYAPEQRARYDDQPQRQLQSIVQPAPQHQQPLFSFEHRRPALMRPHLSYQQPLEIDREPPSDRNPEPYFDRMSKDELREWSRNDDFPISHNRSVLIKQAKTRERITVVNSGEKYEGKSPQNPIVIELDPDVREFTYEDPEESRTRHDANEPGTRNYLYSPPAEAEPAVNQSQETPEHEDPGGPNSLDDAGPSTSGS